jgi:hypothetical protein
MDFSKTMARLPDEELLRIAYPDAGDEFETDAITAARAEISKRGISEHERPQLQSRIAELETEDSERAEQPLGKGGWVAFMLTAPILILSIPAALVLYAMGYRRMAGDARGAIVGGWLIYLLLLFILAVGMMAMDG